MIFPFLLQLCLQGWLSLRCGRGHTIDARLPTGLSSLTQHLTTGNVPIYVSIYVSILSIQKFLSFPKLNHDLVFFVQGIPALCIPFVG